MFEKFPYTNFHELNLDWILDRMKKNSEDQEALKKYVDEVFSGIGNLQGEGWLKNKKIVVYGDSTTQIENSYIKKLSDYGAIITNRGVYGTAIVTNNDKTGAIDLIPKAEDLNDFDYIFMCYGANDLGGWDYNFPFEKSIETSDNYLNYCLETIFNFLKTKTCYPIFILPPIVHQDSWGKAQTNAYNGSTQDLFNDTVVAICEQYHIEYFNLFTLCPVNHENYTYWYLQDNTQGIWIHPNNRLNTVIFNQILSRNSNNGYCYQGEWSDCSEVLASPTQHTLFTPVIANMPDNAIKNAVFFTNYQSTSKFVVSSNDGSNVRLRISAFITALSETFGQEQIIYRKISDSSEHRLCLFSRQKNKTSVTFELEPGVYEFSFYNTSENNIAAINLKFESQNGYVKPYDYVLTKNNLSQNCDLKIHFLRNGIEVIGAGVQIAATGTVESGTRIANSESFEFVNGDTPFIYFATGTNIKICKWKNGLIALDNIENNLRISTLGQHYTYRNLFDL